MVQRALGALTAIVVLFAAFPSSAAGQAANLARVFVTVLDPAKAGAPGATVTLLGLDDATKKAVVAPATTTGQALATFERVPLGRYSIRATLNGFDAGTLPDVTVRAGDNRVTVILVLRTVTENVNAGGTQQDASSRTASAFGLTLSREAIDTLSDNPDALARELRDLAGPDAVIRVDSFEGAQLPPKSQIKSVHVTRDQFAAEAEFPGSTFVDIITQPGAGALAGNATFTHRLNSLAGTSAPFINARQPESNRNFNGTLSGSFIPGKGDFSLSVNNQRQLTTPLLTQTGAATRLLGQQEYGITFVNALVNYALTRDQTLRLGVASQSFKRSNQGIGQYDSQDRAFTTRWDGFQVRVQEAGPMGRRTFHNTRLFVTSWEQSQRAQVEAPTVVILDSRTIGGAQTRGSTKQTNYFFASDVDYIRGIHSWRAGVQINGGWFDSNTERDYLGTYTFATEEDFRAGRPMLYTRTIGDPRVTYVNRQTAFYLQDDLRISRSLTLSPGVRYMFQNLVDDWGGLAPRFGMTWSPFRNGRTTFRTSAGVFYWPMEMATVYEPSRRFDGSHQQQVVIVNPSYPDPGVAEGLPPNKYLLGRWSLQRNVRYSGGIDHTFSPRLRANVLYAYWLQFEHWNGVNLNTPVNGVRPDPNFANVIQAVTTGNLRRHDVTVNVNASLVAPGPAANAARFNWRRVAIAATYAKIRAWQVGDGVYAVSPTGTFDTEWAPNTLDLPYRTSLSITSTQLRNLNVNVGWNTQAGSPYTQLTGIDNNGDGILNDRPDGVSLRSLRAAGQSTLNIRGTYVLIPPAPPGTAGLRRMRASLNVNATNVTNRANFGGYSGNMLSDNFQRPTMVVNPRRVDVGLTIGF